MFVIGDLYIEGVFFVQTETTQVLLVNGLSETLVVDFYDLISEDN